MKKRTHKSKVYFESLQGGKSWWEEKTFEDFDFVHTVDFTGFYAKDEKPCYEGDIINFGGYNLAIVFQKGEFVGKFREEIEDENIPGFIIRHEAHNFEIVGNVFENLDLVSSTSILPKKS